jgi:hypothetical protein
MMVMVLVLACIYCSGGEVHDGDGVDGVLNLLYWS